MQHTGRAADGTVELTDGRALAWESTGAPGDPPVLWLHGSTGSRRSLPPPAGLRVLGYDRPGVGGSTHHPGRDLRSDVEDVRALLDAAGLRSVTVLAFSGGAATGYALGALASERVAGLCVVPGATWPMAPPPSDAALRAAAERLRADPGAAVGGLVDAAPAPDRAALAEPGVRGRLLDGARDAVGGGVEGLVHEARLVRRPWPFAAEDVVVPVELWHGTEDDAVPFYDAVALSERLPSATLHVLPGCGHLGWLGHLGRIADGLRGPAAAAALELRPFAPEDGAALLSWITTPWGTWRWSTGGTASAAWPGSSSTPRDEVEATRGPWWPPRSSTHDARGSSSSICGSSRTTGRPAAPTRGSASRTVAPIRSTPVCACSFCA